MSDMKLDPTTGLFVPVEPANSSTSNEQSVVNASPSINLAAFQATTLASENKSKDAFVIPETQVTETPSLPLILPTPPVVTLELGKTEYEKARESMTRILKEHGGLESNVPIHSEYWSFKNIKP